MDEQEFHVERAVSRVDVFLSEKLDDLTRRKARELCEQEKVEVNGKPARAGQSLLPGDTVRILEPWTPVRAQPELADSALEMLFYEDEHFLVVNKPRAMASVRLRPEDPPTVADWVVSHSASCLTASPDPRESGLVQRLDFYTSGLLLAAKDRESWETLRKQLFAEEIEKSYLALIERRPVKKKFTISIPLAQSKDGKTMCAAKETGERSPIQLSAVTEIAVVNQLEHDGRGFSLVRAKGRRVRRHQIRAHLALSGHPLVGDQMYGSSTQLEELVPSLKEGFLLHAESIAMRHPVTDEQLHFTCDSRYCDELMERY